MSRFLALSFTIACTAGLPAQNLMYSAQPYAPTYPMTSPQYSTDFGPTAMISDPSFAYRTMGTPDYTNLAMGYTLPYYMPGYGYVWNQSYGFAYNIRGDRAYINAVEGLTSIPYTLAAPAPMSTLFTVDRVAYTPRVAYNEAPMPTNTGRVTAYVPADAELIVQGQVIPGTGSVRTFETPALSGPDMISVVVRTKNNGKSSDQKMNVTVQPGSSSSVAVLR